MQHDKIQYIKYCLMQKLENLRSVAGCTLQQLKISNQKYSDIYDEAAVDYSKAVELAVRAEERNLMLDIQETIMRIDRGLFGTCDRCSQKIPEERLINSPMSKLCYDCQNKLEHKNRYRNKKILPVKSKALNNVY